MATPLDKPDLVIRNARLIDGTGAPARPGDLAVSDDRIVALGDLGRVSGAQEVDAGGRALEQREQLRVWYDGKREDPADLEN